MDKEFEILKSLAGYKPSPPQMAFAAIKEGIAQQKNIEFTSTLKQLSDFQVAPPSFIFDAVLDTISDKKFAMNTGLLTLKDFISVPPSHLLDNILKQTQLNIKKSVFAKVININVSRKFLLQIAASLLLCLLASLVYFVSFNVSIDYADVSEHKEPVMHAAIANNDLAVLPVQLKNESYTKPVIHHKTKKIVAPKEILEDGTELLKETSLVVNGVNIAFVDNDFFATFTSFNVTTDFLNNVPEGQDVTVKLNNFSSIAISAKMQEMMKKMYRTKKNGKIPNSAKKIQKKLSDWKIDDNKTFDLNFSKNPVDALDLFDYLTDYK